MLNSQQSNESVHENDSSFNNNGDINSSSGRNSSYLGLKQTSVPNSNGNIYNYQEFTHMATDEERTLQNPMINSE